MKVLSRNEGERGLHELFEISVLLKGAGALLESVLGVLLLYTNSIVDFVVHLVENELLDDPNDFFANHVHSLISASHGNYVFGGLYLLSHGVVKLFLVAGLLRGKLWAYPASLAVFSLFILYQLVRFTRDHSLWLLALTALDVVVMWLIYHEYQTVKKGKKLTPLV